MMEYVHALILGVVQGIAEFLPISSSGHLVIADALLREYTAMEAPKESVTMEIALHFGTLLSILVIYRQDLRRLLSDYRLMAFIVLATIPVGVIGLLFKSQLEQAFQNPLVAGCALLVTAVFLLVGRMLQQSSGKKLSELTAKDATVIGIFQAIAIIPGISRSGSTIAAGMANGLDRESAARFSFLIAIPAIGGATVLQLRKLVGGSETAIHVGPLVLGTVIAFVVGLVALRWLIRIVVADRLHLFAIYCICAGGLTVAWQLLK